MAEKIWTLLTTVDSAEKAAELARQAIAGKRAACAQIEPGILSVFSWKGTMEETTECRILFKVSGKMRTSLEGWLKREHPYDVPEILAWEVQSANEDYTKWVENG